MTHPITALQGALVAALRADTALTALIGAEGVVDAPARGMGAPYLAIARHDATPRDGDLTPGLEHRVVLNAWHDQASRAAVLAIADRVIAVALAGGLEPDGRRVTHARHERTDTGIDLETGQARAVVALRFYSEPTGI